MADSPVTGQHICSIIKTTSIASPSDRLQLNFNFFFKYEYFKWIHDQDSMWLVAQCNWKDFDETAVANVDDLSKPEDIIDPIKKVLESQLPEHSTNDLTEHIWENFRSEFIAGNKIVDIDMDVHIQDHVFSVGRNDCFIGESSCCICLEDLSDDEQRKLVLGLPCSHFFHMDCIQEWVEKSSSCPLCRRHVSETPDFLTLHNTLSLAFASPDQNF